MIEIDWGIDGEPCTVEVLGVTPGEPETGPYYQAGELADPGTPAVPPEYEYRILDVTGTPSNELMAKVDSAEHWRIVAAIEEAFKQDEINGDY